MREAMNMREALALFGPTWWDSDDIDNAVARINELIVLNSALIARELQRSGAYLAHEGCINKMDTTSDDSCQECNEYLLGVSETVLNHSRKPSE